MQCRPRAVEVARATVEKERGVRDPDGEASRAVGQIGEVLDLRPQPRDRLLLDRFVRAAERDQVQADAPALELE